MLSSSEQLELDIAETYFFDEYVYFCTEKEMTWETPNLWNASQIS